MEREVVKLRAGFDDALSAGLNAATAAIERNAKALDKLAVSSEKEEVVARRVGKSHEAVAKQIDGKSAALAKQEAALARYERALDAVNKAEQREKITAEEAAKQRERLAILRDREVAKAIEHGRALDASFAGTARSSETLARTTNATSMAMRSLGIQSIDVFQQLASGAPVMMTLVQQGGQVGQMAAVTGTRLSDMAKEVGALALRFAPWIAATATVAGLGVAIYSVGQRAADLDAQQRALSVAIRGVGRDAELSTERLQGYVTALKQQGVAAADAVKAIAELSRNSGLSGGMIGRIAGLAPDAAAALGQGVPETMRALAEAAKGTAESVQKLDDAFSLLTGTEAAQVRAMLEHGDKAGALETVFAKLEARVKGLNTDALSQTDRVFRDLGNSWDGFIDRVAKSAPVMAMINALGATLRAASSLIDGTPAAGVDAIDARLSALSGTIPGNNATAARLRREQAQARAALLAERAALAQSGADAAEFGFGIPPAGLPGSAFQTPEDARSREIQSRAAGRVAGAEAGRLGALNREAAQYRERLAQLAPGTQGFAEASAELRGALAAVNKEIEDLNKKSEVHRTGLEKSLDTYAAQTRAAEELARAYGVGRDAVARILATREAEQKAIGEGLIPGTAKYAATVRDLTDAVLAKQKAEGSAKVEEQLRDAREQTDATRRMAEAYDGTEASIRRVREEEAARSAVIKSGLTPGMEGYAEAVERLAAAYADSSEAARAFQHAQDSVRSLFGAFSTTLDRLGQGLVDLFLNGSRAAVSFGSLARAAFASIATEVVRLGAVNPVLNLFSSSPMPTLGAAVGALSGGGQGSSGGGMLSGLGNVLSLGRVTDTLGLTNLGGRLAGLGQSLGITGEGGLLSGISGFINSPILGQAALTSATNSALASLPTYGVNGVGMATYGPATVGQVGFSGYSIGDLLGGFGVGFGAGSLGGGLLQSALGKTGPAPTIGAGLGAAIGSIFGPVGGLIGGLLGGGGGAFIGPGKPNSFSATGLTLDGNGMLGVGRTVSQLANTAEEVAALQRDVQQINSVLAASGARVTNATSLDEFGQNRIVDANAGTWINVGQGDGRAQNLSFSSLRFGASDPMINAAISSRAFSDANELSAALSEFTTFLQQTAPALKALSETGDPSYGVGTLATSLQTLREQFDAAKITADKLGWAEYDLVAARERALKTANDNVAAVVLEADRSLLSRRYMAEGIASGDIQKQLDSVLWDFDAATQAQRKERRAALLTVFGDAYEATQDFAERMRLLEETRGAERLAAAKSYLDQINAAQTQQARAMEQASGSAASIVQSITGYVRGLTVANDSPLSAGQRYSSASAQFQRTLAAATGGDANALAGLTNAAETFRLQSRGMFGSGAQYANDVQSIVTALQGIALTSPESLTNTVYLSGMQTQTQTLVASLAELRAEVASLKSALILATTNGPPAQRAA